MPNLIELIDRSNIITEKVNTIITTIKNGIISGDIPNKTMAFIRLRDEVYTFINSLVSTTITLRPAYKIPISDDINNMMKEAFYDITNIFSNINLNDSVIGSSYDNVNIERNMFSYMTKYVDNRINELESEILQNTGVISYSDTFINYSNSDMELVEDVKANIDISAGALTLDKISIINQPTPNIAITDKSTGLPGDTHQAYISGEEITYSGELDQHTNLQYLTDGEKDTWFEYEELQIPQNEYDKVNGYGFEYKEGYRWIMDSSTNSLTLELELTYKKPYNMNWIMIDPFLPVESSYIPASITTVDITDSKGIVTQLVVDAISFRRETILMFSMQKVKKITIRLKQENKYITRIGHTYYTNLDTNQNMLNTINPDSIRIDGPAPSIEYIGIKYEPATGRYIQPIMDELYNPPDSRKIFTELNNDPRVYTGNELINAYRYQIAIRSIETACIEFGTISQYLSQNFDFSTLNNANRLKLIVDSEDNKGTIVYSISIDNGVNWRSITNNEELELASFTNARLKIDMIRDPLDKYSSPVIYNYSLQGRKV